MLLEVVGEDNCYLSLIVTKTLTDFYIIKTKSLINQMINSNHQGEDN